MIWLEISAMTGTSTIYFDDFRSRNRNLPALVISPVVMSMARLACVSKTLPSGSEKKTVAHLEIGVMGKPDVIPLLRLMLIIPSGLSPAGRRPHLVNLHSFWWSSSSRWPASSKPLAFLRWFHGISTWMFLNIFIFDHICSSSRSNQHFGLDRCFGTRI